MHQPITPLSTVGITRYHRPESAYLKLRNDFARNAQISLRAFRVASYILSHQDGFTQTQQQIARACGLSVNTVRAALEDLREDGYLVSRRLREGGRWIGTAYAVSDIPFTPAEVDALVGPCADSEHSGSEHSESAHPKKISSRSETTTREEQTPSGGATAPAAPPSLDGQTPGFEEESVPTKTPPQPGLFDLPSQPSSSQPKTQGPSTAQQVVAAYVDSFATHHAGGRPLKSDIGRVARDAKAILDQGAAGPEELTQAAVDMGKGRFSNLGMALKILRDRGARHAGRQSGVPARPHTDPYWVAVAEENERSWREELATDDDAIRWVQGDPAEVEKILAKWPELADRFRDVA